MSHQYIPYIWPDYYMFQNMKYYMGEKTIEVFGTSPHTLASLISKHDKFCAADGPCPASPSGQCRGGAPARASSVASLNKAAR
eukprot:1637612-Pyramimonas_sp.AAC.1